MVVPESQFMDVINSGLIGGAFGLLEMAARMSAPHYTVYDRWGIELAYSGTDWESAKAAAYQTESLFAIRTLNESWSVLLAIIPKAQGQTRKESNKNSQTKAGKRPKAKYDHERYKKCLEDLFETEIEGADDHLDPNLFAGYFGADKTAFSILLDYSKDKKEITKENKGVRSVGYASTGSDMTVYIASDIKGLDRLVTEIHEIGNKIYAKFKIVGLTKPEVSAGLQKKLKKAKLEDDDAGMALEECVFGGRVLADGTVLK